MTWQDDLSPTQRKKLRPAQPAWQPPMLATLVEGPPRGDWIYERKLDGYRVIAVCDTSGGVLHGRSGRDVSDRFPFTKSLPDRCCVLDGEAVAFRDGDEDFGAVQNGQATHLVFFDIQELDGQDVRALPWYARRALLDEVDLGPRCSKLPWSGGDGKRMHAAACEAGWEGLMAKRRDAPYCPGRSRDWRKLKCVEEQEFVIGGYTEPQGARQGLGALLVGYQDGGLRYAGKVGTGFDDATLGKLQAMLEDMERADPPFADAPAMQAHWVEPQLVCQVGFTQWTRDGRLHHPRFKGLRDDKRAVEVVRES